MLSCATHPAEFVLVQRAAISSTVQTPYVRDKNNEKTRINQRCLEWPFGCLLGRVGLCCDGSIGGFVCQWDRCCRRPWLGLDFVEHCHAVGNLHNVFLWRAAPRLADTDAGVHAPALFSLDRRFWWRIGRRESNEHRTDARDIRFGMGDRVGDLAVFSNDGCMRRVAQRT